MLCELILPLPLFTQIGGLTESEATRFFISDPQKLCRANVVLFFIFITRGVYEVFTLKGYWYLPELALNADRDLDWRCDDTSSSFYMHLHAYCISFYLFISLSHTLSLTLFLTLSLTLFLTLSLTPNQIGLFSVSCCGTTCHWWC